jgi:hypothetical protein
MFLMLFISYHHLHALFQTKNSFANTSHENNNLNIFEMVVNIYELANELVTQQHILGFTIG